VEEGRGSGSGGGGVDRSGGECVCYFDGEEMVTVTSLGT
nr:hypothetical protein [Tanacetum cinerariifolium]